MKKSILIFCLLACINSLSAQSFATLRLGSINASTLTPGDTISVPVYCDEISAGTNVLSFEFSFTYDHSVLVWPDTLQIYFGGYYDWLIIDDGTNMYINWVDPTFGGGQPILPGEMFCEIYFIYYGGETGLNWQPETVMVDQFFIPFNLTLIDGCVCFYDNYAVTFHVTSDGNNLENAVVTIGDQSDTTDVMGLADFMLPDGNYVYTVTKEGYAAVVDSITVAGAPVQVEVEMEVCYNLTFHIIGCDSVTIIINGITLVTSVNGSATICLPNGSYPFSIFAPGYIQVVNSILINGANLIINVIMFPILYDVTFFVNCCGEPLENYPITYEGQTVTTDPSGVALLNLPTGFYSFEIGGFPVTFTVPDTTYVEVDVCSEVTFHVTDDDGNPLEGVLIEIDNINLFTDMNGEADTCLQFGTHTYTAFKPGFVSQSGTFEVDTIAQNIEIVMPLATYPVTYYCNSTCANGYNGWFFSINGISLVPGETIYLPSGSYYTSYGYTGCSVISGMVIINYGALNINCGSIGFVEPHATFHVSSALGGNLQGAIVEVDTFSLVTNYSGDASFCLPGGDFNYSVTKEGYGTYSGIFNYVNYCQDTVVEILMDPVLVNNHTSSGIRLYPNPSGGMFYLENLSRTDDFTDITIKDISGRIVYQENSVTDEKVEIDLTGQPKGMYFISAKSGKNILNEKLVIQ